MDIHKEAQRLADAGVPDTILFRGRALEREPRSRRWVSVEGDDLRRDILELEEIPHRAEQRKPSWVMTHTLNLDDGRGEDEHYIESKFGATPYEAMKNFEAMLAGIRKSFP